MVKWKNLITAIAIPLAVGSLSALLTQGSMQTFSSLRQPPLSPPGFLFPVVWTVLYVLMGIASYLAAAAPGQNETALRLYGLQLVFNFFWSIFFFNFGWYLFSFIWLVALWLLILATALSFYQSSKTAGLLMLPYLLWVTFAGYLNLGIFLLN